MKFEYSAPAADVRFLLSQDIIATSEEGNPSGLIPEDNLPDDTAPDTFDPLT